MAQDVGAPYRAYRVFSGEVVVGVLAALGWRARAGATGGGGVRAQDGIKG